MLVLLHSKTFTSKKQIIQAESLQNQYVNNTHFSKNKTRMTSKNDKYKPQELGGPLTRLISLPQVRILEACKHLYYSISTHKNPSIDIQNAYIMEQVYRVGVSIGIYKIHQLLNADLSQEKVSSGNLDPLICLSIQNWHTLKIIEPLIDDPSYEDIADMNIWNNPNLKINDTSISITNPNSPFRHIKKGALTQVGQLFANFKYKDYVKKGQV